jgi:hypothetical protein
MFFFVNLCALRSFMRKSSSMRKRKKSIYTQRHEAHEVAQRNTLLLLLLPLLLERGRGEALKVFVRREVLWGKAKSTYTQRHEAHEGAQRNTLLLLLPLLLERVGVRLLKNFVRKSFMRKAKRIYTLRNRFVEIREIYMPPILYQICEEKNSLFVVNISSVIPIFQCHIY